jgi:hypothetical protein
MGCSTEPILCQHAFYQRRIGVGLYRHCRAVLNREDSAPRAVSSPTCTSGEGDDRVALGDQALELHRHVLLGHRQEGRSMRGFNTVPQTHRCEVPWFPVRRLRGIRGRVRAREMSLPAASFDFLGCAALSRVQFGDQFLDARLRVARRWGFALHGDHQIGGRTECGGGFGRGEVGAAASDVQTLA